ncbi:MAG: hypothetical protein HY235_24745 [Acidobacteria bacterium]|nr:hypothetical protein [Acidobacteriota bacterium]
MQVSEDNQGAGAPARIHRRLWKAFADGFGGGILGGLAYWCLASLFQAGGAPFPWLQVMAIALGCGVVEVYRVGRRPRASV